MRVSQFFRLGRGQPELDFVDVDTATDARVFIDPRAIRIQQSSWSYECEALLASFFGALLDAIARRDERAIQYLLGQLSEPNETHLGYSKGRSRGRGLGGVGAERVAYSIANSAAAKSGLLADLDDSALFIPGIGSDIISDISTHILRGALIGYTQKACDYYGIDMHKQHSGVMWNPDTLEWDEGMVDLPRTPEGTLLLVPKSIVRFKLALNEDKYFSGFLAPLYENREIDARSNLVRILKNGSAKVDRAALTRKYPLNKLAIVEYTREFPSALPEYKASITRTSSPVLNHEQIADALDVPRPDYDDLLDRAMRIPPGNGGAVLYHKAAEQLLTALFYPYVGNVRLEREIHEGRKRIDICYDNLAGLGTFFWLGGAPFKAREIPVECKNYRQDPTNPELDQLSSRFSDRRGWLGILACRKLYNKDLFLTRCRDTAVDGRGYVIPVDDEDLKELVRERKVCAGLRPRERAMFKLLRERVDYLIR